jgi:opacity protein-like surface antigen
MLKKIILFSTAFTSLSLSPLIQANGFYLTTDLGYHILTDTVKGNDVDGLTEIEFDLDQPNYGNGVVGVLSVGYEFIIVPHFGISLEADGELSSAGYQYHEHGVLGDNETLNYGEDYNGGFGINVRPAYLITPRTKFYAVLGYVEGNFRNFVNDVVNEPGTSDATSYSRNVWSAGYLYGLGMATALPTRIPLDLGIEVTQARYGNSRYTDMSGSATSTLTNYVHTPVVTEMLLRLVWKI